MAKAERDGIYTLNGGRFRMRAGQTLPDGAVIEPNADELAAVEAAPETTERGPAPENKAKRKPAETKAKA